jgi:adenylate cyclase
LLNSKELLERTGISRATLNNYIALGIVPKPDVLPPEPDDGAAPRIGYFPEDTVQRIAEIQRLKNQGWSMAAIAEHFAHGRQPASRADAPPAPAPSGGAASPPVIARGGPPLLSVDRIVQPAWLVDRDFALVWSNAAGAAVLGRPQAGASVFTALVARRDAPPAAREELIRFHLAIAKQQGVTSARVLDGIAPSEQSQLQRLYAAVAAMPADAAAHVLIGGEGAAASVCVYAVQFREGILFVQVPVGAAAGDLSPLLAARELSVRAVARSGRPVLSDVAVLAMDLQDATRIWSTLPAEEYFELIDQIWLTAEPIVARHKGTPGKHPGDGMVCYFLPQPDTDYVWNALLAASEIRDAMRRVSKEWQLRKGWTTELYLNVGVDEGQQWLGTLRSGRQVDFTMFGDTLNRATRISDFARFGAIWATKNLVVKLAAEVKQRLKYGVHRRDKEGRHAFVSSVFATPDRLADAAGPTAARLQDIGRLPITEIVDVAAPAARRERPSEPNPN